MSDESFMLEALAEARLGITTPGGAEVGCVIVRDNKIVCRAFNEATMWHDPTAHAEMVGIRRLSADWKTLDLSTCTLYCTLQPCGMCTMACIWAGISRIVYGATRSEVNAKYFASRLFDTDDLIRNAFRNDLEVRAGVLSEECSKLYLAPTEPAETDPAHTRTIPPY